jgi:hypothetical protein
LRLELRDLQRNHPDQWTLYILGIQAFQQLDEKTDLSYYGIAGMFVLLLADSYLLFKAFMDVLTDLGVASREIIPEVGKDTAPIVPSSLLHGIVHTWHCSR